MARLSKFMDVKYVPDEFGGGSKYPALDGKWIDYYNTLLPEASNIKYRWEAPSQIPLIEKDPGVSELDVQAGKIERVEVALDGKSPCYYAVECHDSDIQCAVIFIPAIPSFATQVVTRNHTVDEASSSGDEWHDHLTTSEEASPENSDRQPPHPDDTAKSPPGVPVKAEISNTPSSDERGIPSRDLTRHDEMIRAESTIKGYREHITTNHPGLRRLSTLKGVQRKIFHPPCHGTLRFV